MQAYPRDTSSFCDEVGWQNGRSQQKLDFRRCPLVTNCIVKTRPLQTPLIYEKIPVSS